MLILASDAIRAELLSDESSFVKQGPMSVSVSRQRSCRLGKKVENRQVAVFGILARKQPAVQSGQAVTSEEVRSSPNKPTQPKNSPAAEDRAVNISTWDRLACFPSAVLPF